MWLPRSARHTHNIGGRGVRALTVVSCRNGNNLRRPRARGVDSAVYTMRDPKDSFAKEDPVSKGEVGANPKTSVHSLRVPLLVGGSILSQLAHNQTMELSTSVHGWTWRCVNAVCNPGPARQGIRVRIRVYRRLVVQFNPDRFVEPIRLQILPRWLSLCWQRSHGFVGSGPWDFNRLR
jgi:hypothetical protein